MNEKIKTIWKWIKRLFWWIGGIGMAIWAIYKASRQESSEDSIEELHRQTEELNVRLRKDLETIEEKTDANKQEVKDMDAPSLIRRFTDNMRNFRTR